ncbi:hypothetical protein [Microbulbifer epialgicus]|uniref:Uncharacterized protein n=1 Tax=Microbulbifer epialgicus TaxID=393907 RepID=A0ABV4P223_9GAMM
MSDDPPESPPPPPPPAPPPQNAPDLKIKAVAEKRKTARQRRKSNKAGLRKDLSALNINGAQAGGAGLNIPTKS